MAKDKVYIKLIHASQWVELRCRVLSAQPLCERCKAEGIITAAVEVHHITPVEHGTTYAEKRRLCYDPANLMALCHGCHVRIHTELGRCGREAMRKRNTEQVRQIIKKFFGCVRDLEPGG